MSSFCHSNRGAFELFPYCTSHKFPPYALYVWCNAFKQKQIHKNTELNLFT